MASFKLLEKSRLLVQSPVVSQSMRNLRLYPAALDQGYGGRSTSKEPSKPTQVAQDVAHKVSDFVGAQVEKVKNWYNYNASDDLKAQVTDVNDILERANKQMAHLKQDASDKVRRGLDNIRDYRDRVADFNRRIAQQASDATKPDELKKFKDEWAAEVKRMYEGGLDDVKQALDKMKPRK